MCTAIGRPDSLTSFPAPPGLLASRISLGKSIEELHEVLYRFREMRGMHLWLRERRERNQKIPENTEDMGPMIADTEGVPLTKFM